MQVVISYREAIQETKSRKKKNSFFPPKTTLTFFDITKTNRLKKFIQTKNFTYIFDISRHVVIQNLYIRRPRLFFFFDRDDFA